MKRKTRFVALLWALAFLGGSCAVPSSPVSSQSGSTTTTLDLTKPGNVIKSLNLGTATLPASLQTGSASSSSQSGRSLARSLGDVTTLTSLTLPSLKSSGYQQLLTEIQNPNVIKSFLDALKGNPAIANGTLGLNTVIDTGNVTMVEGPFSIILKNSGRLSTSLSADGQTLNIYWNMMYPDTSTIPNTVSPTDPAYQSDVDAAPRLNIKLNITVQKSGVAEAYAYLALISASGQYMNYYAKSDPTTNTSIAAQDSIWSAHGQQSLYVQEVLPQSGSGVLVYSNQTTGVTSSYESLAYADNTFGGLASIGTSTLTINGTSQNDSYINVEYYDGTGNLVYQGWGDSLQNSNNWSWMSNYAATGLNLYDANLLLSHAEPSTLILQYDQTARTYCVSLDGGTTWTASIAVPAGFSGWSVFWAPDSHLSGSTWTPAAGDSVYWSSSWSSFTTGSGHFVSQQTYYLGYQVPTGVNYFNQTYFVNKSYPLKNLLPLQAQYATGYALEQLEGATWYSWEDTSGNWQSNTVAPTTGYQTGTLNNWTSYTYWLENLNYKNSSGVNDNSPSTFDAAKGDVSVNLNNQSVYYWNATTGAWVSQQSPFFSTYQSALPPYFSLSQATVNSVAATKARLESFYTNKSSFSASSYLTGFMNKMTPLLANFPSLVGYTGYTGS